MVHIDKLWFYPNDEQVQESKYGAQEPGVGEESVCVTPPIREDLFAMRAVIGSGVRTRLSTTKTK